MNIAVRIMELCNKRNISINKLANLADLTQSTLNSIMNSRDPNPQYKTIEKICAGLNISLSDFFTVIKPEPELEPDLLRLLETVKKLSPNQRERLQKLLEAMQK